MHGLDTVKYHETPEGIVLRLRIAGPVVRACAWLIDLAVKGGVGFVLIMVLSLLGTPGMGILLVSLFLLEWFYPVLFEVMSGATPGKKAMALLVINDNGTPVAFAGAALRNLLRAVDFFPLFYGAGLITTLINKDFKRLGDMAAGTLVVHAENAPTARPVQENREITPSRPPADLRVNEQRTLLDFAERGTTLSRERRIELAEILSDLTGKTGEPALKELEGYAMWLYRGKTG